jgi:uncharacterized protein YprB with RNaseH-like and TPR domain
VAKTWTDAELAALDEVAGEAGMAAYHAFGARTNYSKSYDAFEVKRRRIFQGRPDVIAYGDAVPAPRVTATPAETEDFVGFSMAYWDLETTFSTQPLVLFGAIADQFGRVTEFRKGPDITNDRDIVKSIRDALVTYDIWVTWNGVLFDVPVLNGRLIYHGFEPLPATMHIDAMYKASGGSVRIGRRSLESVSRYYEVENKKTPLSVREWDKAMAGDAEAYEKIAEHGHADVLVTRDVFRVLKPQVRNIQRK